MAYSTNDLINELETNFIEYAAACNTDRAIPNATDGLKPVAKRILYCAYDCGFKHDKPHVKSANIVGRTMASWHPHGDSSIYGALVYLSQQWQMRYPLIDFHGSNGNIDGDGAASSRYTEARLSKITEDGMLVGINKKAVDFIPNYSETEDEPIEFPSIFPNLLCNPHSGIGVSLACNWAPHNLREVAAAINDYLDGKEATLPGPDFPTGGIIINKSDIPKIMETGKGSVKIRGKYDIEDGNKIVFTELPYGTATEVLLNQINELCENETIKEITDIRNESNKKGIRLVIECITESCVGSVVARLFLKTDLQKSFSYNQIALVNKTPTDLTLKDCLKIYCEHNSNCIKRECQFDLNKTNARLHIIEGILKALDHIDEIIKLIKTSASSSAAKDALTREWGFDEPQAQAILDMKLSKLAKLEKDELIAEQEKLLIEKSRLEAIILNPTPELKKRLADIVSTYGDDRRTELTDIKELSSQEKKDLLTIPVDCAVVLTENGLIKRVPMDAYKVQRRSKASDPIISEMVIGNTVDTLLVFTTAGKLHKIKINDIAEGTNSSKGIPINSLLKLDPEEIVKKIYPMSKIGTNEKYVVYITQKGLVKRQALDHLTKPCQIIAVDPKDPVISICFVNDEDLVVGTKNGKGIRFNSSEIAISYSKTLSSSGITLAEDDEVRFCVPYLNKEEQLFLALADGQGKKIKLDDIPAQKKGGKGRIIMKIKKSEIVNGFFIKDTDNIYLTTDKTPVTISAKDISCLSRESSGVKISKNGIKSAVKI